jgi:hypothetical protein
MTAFLVFSRFEPLIVLASKAAVRDGRMVRVLAKRGLAKFIAHEVPVEKLRLKYGLPFEVIGRDVKEEDDTRVLDCDGRRVFESLPFSQQGECIRLESES